MEEKIEKPKTVRILIKEPYKEPYEKVVDNNLETFQEIVGGLIECVEMPGMKNVDLFVNEEGKLDRLQGNFWLPEYEDCAVGTCYLIGYNPKDGSNLDLTDKQIKQAKKYIDLYKIPDGMDLYEDFYILRALMTKRYNIQKRKNAEM